MNSVVLQPDLLGIHSWGIVSGLLALHRAGEIELRLRDLRARECAGQVLHLLVDDVRCALDLSDSPQLHPAAQGDIVLKRSHRPGAYDARDVRPLGLYAGYRRGDEGLLLGHAWHVLKVHGVALAASQARASMRLLLRAPEPPTIRLFVRTSREPGRAQPVAVYQVKAWQPSAGTDPADRDAVNAQRALLIKTLRSELGRSFVGGFVPDDFARKAYSGLLADGDGRRAAYAGRLRQSAVGVSTRGLHGSDPWKLVEYLAAGLAILSEPLQNSLPEGHEGGLGGIEFWSTPQECAARALSLLSSPERLAQSRSAAENYYRAHVEPVALVRRCLKQVTRS